MTEPTAEPRCPLPRELVLSSTIAVLAGANLHAQTAESIANAVVGLLNANRLSVTAIGSALGRVTGHRAKHGVKQVDRLMSNELFDVEHCQESYVQKVLGQRKSIVVGMDWTEYALDGQATIAISLITKHGRATPLVWRTVESWSLKHRRNRYEDELLAFFQSCLPKRKLLVIVLADRGFGDAALYEELENELSFEFVIRFRGEVYVEHNGVKKRANEWLRGAVGNALMLGDVRVTHKGQPVANFVAVHDPAMKDAWYLASSLRCSARAIVKLYGRRFSMEETFRDQKDLKFGWGLYETQVTRVERRDRLLMVAALAQLLLTLIGAAGEELNLDLLLRVNTENRRTHSLFRQGREYFKGLLEATADLLRRRFEELFASLENINERFAHI